MIKIDDKTKVGDIPHGTKVVCAIDGARCNATFVIEDGRGFLLQDKANGDAPPTINPEDYGYAYSWTVCDTGDNLMDTLADTGVDEFAIVSQTTAKPTKEKVTYQKQFVDSNGVVYTEDKVGSNLVVVLQAEAKKISASLRTHKRLFKKG